MSISLTAILIRTLIFSGTYSVLRPIQESASDLEEKFFVKP